MKAKSRGPPDTSRFCGSSQTARLLKAGLKAEDPSWEVTIARSCYQQRRSSSTATSPSEGRKIAER
jgi:hypothetical protein